MEEIKRELRIVKRENRQKKYNLFCKKCEKPTYCKAKLCSKCANKKYSHYIPRPRKHKVNVELLTIVGEIMTGRTNDPIMYHFKTEPLLSKEKCFKIIKKWEDRKVLWYDEVTKQESVQNFVVDKDELFMTLPHLAESLEISNMFGDPKSYIQELWREVLIWYNQHKQYYNNKRAY